MDGASLVVGGSYAFRERVSTGAPIRRVKLVDVVGRRGKIKIRYEDDPHEGLEEYVSTRNIIVSWGEVRALLRDEKRHAALVEQLSWPDRVIRQAAETVLTAAFDVTGGFGLGRDDHHDLGLAERWARLD